MLKNLFIILFCLACLAAIVIFSHQFPLLTEQKLNLVKNKKKNFHQERTIDNEVIQYDLLDPEEAPDPIYQKVMRGYKILLNTNKLLPDYVDDHLTCANCHIGAGNTLGGKGGGISLVGVVNTYPRFSSRNGKIITLSERINNCFERSMNGKPLPPDSPEMEAIVTYLDWISSKIPENKHYPWLGLKPLNILHTPDEKNGERIYQKNCSLCHQKNGEGTLNNPPIWGPHAFNDGAGMSELPMLSSFIFYNMPYEDPFLTEDEALDVAQFLIKQRRPLFIQN